jgi:hypothetical protein
MLHHPFTMILAGATGCGKTRWLSRFLESADELIIGPCPKRIMYAYGVLNDTILDIQARAPDRVRLHEGCPDEQTIREACDDDGLLLILDDLMLTVKRQFLDTLFTKGSHNWGVSVVFVSQHLFTAEMRTARQNAHYIVLMRNPAGELQVRTLASQLFPGRVPYFMESYRDATKKPFSYLFVDIHPNTPNDQRVKTYISPGETTVVYLPKDSN